MKQQITIKNILAIFIVVFGTIAIVFCEVPDMVLGALIGFIGSILQYFFGSSTGSAAKDKVVKILKTKNKTLLKWQKEPPKESCTQHTIE